MAAPLETRRTRAFLAVGLTGVLPYLMTPLVWLRGGAAFTVPMIVVLTVSFAAGGLALFHFTQVFPWRRPWIGQHGGWLVAGYFVVPPVAACAAWFAGSIVVDPTAGPGAASPTIVAGLLLLLVVPALFLVGIVLPFAGLMSIFKSWQEASAAGLRGARVTTFWMFVSQMAGGVITILIIPLLRFIDVTGVWVKLVAGLTFGFGLVLPIAFATGVWGYRLLEQPPARPDNGGTG